MKKMFSFNVPNKKRARQVEATIHQIRKYMARERRKTLPEKADFWGFDCKIGENEAGLSEIHEKEISKKILELAADDDRESFYIELVVKPQTRQKKKKEPIVQEETEQESDPST